MVDADWSFEEAFEEHYKLYGSDGSDPAAPLNQWFAQQQIKRLKEESKRGDKLAVMMVIKECARSNLVIPDWASDAIVKACEQVESLEVKSWDEVLGSPLRKGHLRTQRRNRKIEKDLYFTIFKRWQNGEAIDAGLFESVGKGFNISGGTVSNMFYKFREKNKLKDFFKK